jgi:hypothetical protein
MSGFTEVPSGYGQRWMHSSGRAWIQLYPETIARRACYQAYVSTGDVPAGRDPQTCDSRRLGNADHGFPSLDEALAAAGAAVQREGA